ncbi:MAG TPA: glycoside hydrolase family 127 protein, partial [Chitinophagaceae bacterium]|nr:glycoside hydrolase family 127 protein [Chitinophagaceae bacterium]HPH31068.1 glycoside hydrolase family 127 protein [Chitinophagaceae bacterium]
MKKNYLTLLLIALAMLQNINLPAQDSSANPFLKIKPLAFRFQALPLSAITPGGWLKTELKRNLDGFTGRLDTLAPDLIQQDDIYGKDRLSKKVKNKNLGAVSDAGEWQAQFLWWNSETQSNWLDGFIRTAILLKDKTQLEKAERLINRLLQTQDKDGYIGIYDPELRYRFDNENGELWSKATLYRALLGWYDYKKDPALLTAIEKAVKNVMDNYPVNQSHPFYSVNPDAGGLTHGLAFTDVLEQLYVLTKKQAYLDYCLFLYKDFSTQTLNEDAQFKKLQQADLPLKGHGVHTYEHLRSVIAAWYASGNPALKPAIDQFIRKINRATTPSGAPVGDEFAGGRAGDATSTGYEFCSLHE